MKLVKKCFLPWTLPIVVSSFVLISSLYAYDYRFYFPIVPHRSCLSLFLAPHFLDSIRSIPPPFPAHPFRCVGFMF